MSRDSFVFNREKMVAEQLVPRGITDSAVLAAMRTIPRHEFIDDAMRSRAYGDYPLPIDCGQTISQPYIVALMTQALELTGEEKVLEIGTGSGYQAAILSRLCRKVYTVDRINSLVVKARKVFDRLRLHNIVSRIDDGTGGWPDEAPFDSIIVTAGGPAIPQPLVEQLADGGRMVIPVGEQDEQELKLIRYEGGEVSVTSITRVRFVNLVGQHGWAA